MQVNLLTGNNLTVSDNGLIKMIPPKWTGEKPCKGSGNPMPRPGFEILCKQTHF